MSNWLTMDDQVKVHVKQWQVRGEKPRAILQLSHGMAEHIERYDPFAQYLVEKGIYVFGNDHRGHGQTGKSAGRMGFLAKQDGFERIVDDLYTITLHIQKEYPETPVFLLGHSMGSFVARRYIQKYADAIQGVIISGTAYSPGVAGKMGKMLALMEERRSGPTAPSPLMNRLVFGANNKSFHNPITAFDWLCSNSEVVENYIDDPLCGFICSSRFFYDLLTGLEMIHDPNLIQTIPKDLPMLIFSGDMDPIGNNGKGIQKVVQQYKKNGLNNIEYKLFTNGRHEMLNEVNKDEVYTFVFDWIQKQIQREAE